jgi:undecaprenyl pyrophosphate synthase
MSWFFKKNLLSTEKLHDQRVEVVVSKEATKKEVELAKEANKQLQNLLLENHFTIKIFLATGGRAKIKRKHV